ncbi:MAG TPA: ATP-binding protein [Pyrinomonadaceae bacterium]|nr:ATP-binding protein [Pyrinomonadaceae bacterium]
MSPDSSENKARRIVGRVSRSEFVGRGVEIQRLIAHPFQKEGPRGLLLMLAPAAGVSELLRQAYDHLFNHRGNIVPIYFALNQTESTPVSAAIDFLNTFLRHYVAYRRNEPSLCEASLTLNDLAQLAPPTDFEWIDKLVGAYNRERFSNDDQALVRFCLSAPQRAPRRLERPFLIVDGVRLAQQPDQAMSFTLELVRALTGSNLPFALAGLRRHIREALHRLNVDFDSIATLKLGKLSEADGSRLIEHVAERHQVGISEETRDLLAQQLECSPFFITSIFQAAREKNSSLTTYRDCEQLYVDDLMGGHIHRLFSSILESIVPGAETRRALVRVLYEAAVADNRRFSFETWRKQLHLEPDQFEKIVRGLHIQEYVNWDGGTIEAGVSRGPWRDYLKIRYRLEILAEPRALIVGDTIAAFLKRAPGTMARHYRRVASLALRDIVSKFDGQRVPGSLLHYDEFKSQYRGSSVEEIHAGLDAETELIRLPQVIHLAGCAAYNPELEQVCDEDRCLVAHAFERAIYTDANEVVWLVAELESKLEVDLDLTQVWWRRLDQIARDSGFGRICIWLVSNEGFSDEASQFLKERKACTSSRQQVAFLTERLEEKPISGLASTADEFVMVLPMGEDNELIAANAAEQIARKLDFQPEAINQIKTAVVEACINAAEHSLSPDRKIYQRFRVESDRLVITISSRGIVPANIEAQNGEPGTPTSDNLAAATGRRGWGLKLIRTLMDEVEFERVDDGTSLRMTKYVRNSSSGAH